MSTLYLTTSEEDLRIAAAVIRTGGLVGFPTETVYGLGGNALDPEASKKIYAAKGRPSDNPLIVHISELDQIGPLVKTFPENAQKLAEAIWPGPMTLVLPKKPVVPDATTGGLDTVAVRMPANPAALRLITLSGCPIAAPSANLSGHPSPTRWQHVRDDLDGRADAIIMGSPCMGGIESTVIDMTGELPQILRPGLITPERVTEILGVPCGYDPAILGKPDPGLVPKAPGMKYKHYAPRAQMTLFSGERSAAAAAMEKEAARCRAEGKKTEVLIYDTSEEAAERLFDDLRRSDSEGADVILAMALPEDESVAFSVMNRMLKSAGYNVIKV
ncbi:MAG: threonylcarbamoyl-AMP synthase [Firmicutes bacterium]|nr:threonylcarbamoyl-AMP synthase [Bacillota bacterium]